MSIILDEFKAFLQCSLREPQAFLNTIQSKMHHGSYYQLEEIMEWIAHLVDLQSILMKFNPFAVPNQKALIRYFWNRLTVSIRDQLDGRSRQLDNQEKVIKKAIDIEAKPICQLLAFFRTMDWLFRTNNFEKDVKIKKSSSLSPTYYISRQSSQSGHGLSISRLNKKNS